MRDHGPTATALLTELGMTGAALYAAASADITDAAPAAVAAAMLAGDAYAAIHRLDSAERHVADHFTRLVGTVETDAANRANGGTGGDPSWILQGARNYADAVAAIAVAADAFRAAARPLAVLTGRVYPAVAGS